jgi:hypothetical protein
MKTKAEIKAQKDRILLDFFKRIGKLNRPPCHKCQHKVPAMLVDVDLDEDVIRIVVKCHEEMEVLKIPVSRIDRISHLELGWAFFDSARINGEQTKTLLIH